MVGGWTGVAGAGAVHGAALCAAVCAAMAAAAAGRAWMLARRRSRLLAVARDVTARYARLLTVKRQQLVAHDGYGNYRLQPWIDHVDYFIGNVVLREARERGIDTRAVRPGTPAWAGLTRALLAILQAEHDGTEAAVPDADIVSGAHYETLCRKLLQAAGWHVDATPVTGDQGADLIADRAAGAGDCRVVIQCKFYSKPVGNKAVQEAHAALGFHAGDRAAVVSNASFTRAARQLAAANGVLLLHHHQLAELASLVDRAGARA